MGFWDWLLGRKQVELTTQTALAKEGNSQEEPFYEPKVRYEQIPGTLDLGWYYSSAKDELQMAKIREKDRAAHLYVLGGTGTGKTKFLEHLIYQDIFKGNGVGVIDPHGDLTEEIKDFLVGLYYNNRDERLLSERVVLIDLTDPKFTVTFNPLEQLPGVTVAEQVSELISAFRKIWSEAWGPRMEDLMRNALIALGEAGFTLADLPSFLTNRSLRKEVVAKVTHPIAKDYFRRFDAMTDRSQAGWIEPVMNKINALLANERLRQMFSHPKSSFQFREVMDQQKVLLVKLDKGKLKDAADLLGSLLLAKLQMAAFSRSDLPQHQRTPFYLYIDEFQNFATETFAVILSEARKYGLSLTMVHQNFSQLSTELRDTILGNTAIQVCFRLNRTDAQRMAKEMFQYSGFEVKAVSGRRPIYWSYGEEWEHKIEELQNLPPRSCYAKHKLQGEVIPLHTVNMEPMWEILDMQEWEFRRFAEDLPIGSKYLVAREELAASVVPSDHEPEPTAEEAESEAKQPEAPARPQAAQPFQQEPATTPQKIEKPKEKPSRKPKEGISQHRYLQALIKHMAEEKGYKAVIEQPILDGQGKVDVSLEQNGYKIACEIAITSTTEQSLANIEKCLKAGYDKVILCSP